jgi:hypothetical protein
MVSWAQKSTVFFVFCVALTTLAACMARNFEIRAKKEKLWQVSPKRV